jgi:hypothetical protein
MPHLSVKISEALYQQLQAKAKEMGHTLSDAIRLLLEDILETPQTKAQNKLYQNLLHYQVSSYYLLQNHLLNSFEKAQGIALNEAAHQKAQAVLTDLFKK